MQLPEYLGKEQQQQKTAPFNRPKPKNKPEQQKDDKEAEGNETEI